MIWYKETIELHQYTDSRHVTFHTFSLPTMKVLTEYFGRVHGRGKGRLTYYSQGFWILSCLSVSLPRVLGPTSVPSDGVVFSGNDRSLSVPLIS